MGSLGAKEKDIRDYDFARPNKLSNDQVRKLQHMHEGIAAQLSAELSSYLKNNIEVHLISLGQLRFEVFKNSLSNPTLCHVLSMSPIKENALVTIDMNLSFSLIDRMLGGDGKSIDEVRPLTAIEQGLMNNVSSRVLNQLSLGWAQVLAFKPRVEAVEMDPQFIQIIPSSEMVLVATFSVQSPGSMETGEMCFCIPFVSLDAVLSDSTKSSQFMSPSAQQSPEQRQHVERVLHNTLVPLSVELGTSQLTIGEVLGLQVGDVLVLDKGVEESLRGFVNGRDQLRCHPGQIGKKTTIMIDAVLPDQADVRQGEQNG